MSNFTCANRAEAVKTIAFIFEDNGVFVTPADVEPLAARVVTERADGVAVFNCTVPELLRLAREFIPLMGERADCPYTWCTGERAAHVSFDSNQWEHASEDDDVAPLGMIYGAIRQTGTAAPSYVLEVDRPRSQPSFTASELRDLASEYERHSALLRIRAEQLEAIAGTQ